MSVLTIIFIVLLVAMVLMHLRGHGGHHGHGGDRDHDAPDDALDVMARGKESEGTRPLTGHGGGAGRHHH